MMSRKKKERGARGRETLLEKETRIPGRESKIGEKGRIRHQKKDFENWTVRRPVGFADYGEIRAGGRQNGSRGAERANLERGSGCKA